jgi:cytochrome P450
MDMNPSSSLPQLRNDGLLGALKRFLGEPLSFFEEARAHDSPFVKLRLAHRTYYYVSDYEVLESMLKDWRTFQKGGGKSARKTLGNGLVFAEDEDWTRQRRIMAPAFHHKALLSYEKIIQEHAQRKLNEWREEQVKNGKANLTRGFFEVAIRILRDTLFGTHANEQELRKVLDGVDVLLQHLIDQEKNPLLPPLWVPTPRNLRSQRCVRDIQEVVLSSIREREQAQDGQITFIDMMMHGRDKKSGEGLSDDNIIDQVKIFFVAGTETSSNTMTFAAYLLAKHPVIMEKLQWEVDQQLKGKPMGMKDLGSLPFLNQVVKETLRLYPATWLNSRVNVRDADLGGYAFKAGSQFMFSIYQMQRDPKAWPEPERFLPSRWASVDERKAHFMPFSAGPRKCIGDQFALAEISLMLASLLQQFRWELPADFVGEVSPSATLQLKPDLCLRLEER